MGHGDSSKGSAKVAWKIVCKPKAHGSLGLKDLSVWNKALLVNHISNIAIKKDTLWVKWPTEWYDSFPVITNIATLILSHRGDKVTWVGDDGTTKNFSMRQVYNDLRDSNVEVHPKAVPVGLSFGCLLSSNKHQVITKERFLTKKGNDLQDNLSS
ncbi:hypothetical protein Tco_1385529 [Tanacetum coccineum]